MKIPLSMRNVDRDKHFTHIIISDLHRSIQKRTEDTIRGYLGSMYRFDLRDGLLKIVYNNLEVKAPDEYEFDTDPAGKQMRRQLPEKIINGKKVNGWVAVLRKGRRRPQVWRSHAVSTETADPGISQRLETQKHLRRRRR